MHQPGVNPWRLQLCGMQLNQVIRVPTSTEFKLFWYDHQWIMLTSVCYLYILQILLCKWLLLSHFIDFMIFSTQVSIYCQPVYVLGKLNIIIGQLSVIASSFTSLQYIPTTHLQYHQYMTPKLPHCAHSSECLTLNNQLQCNAFLTVCVPNTSIFCEMQN